MARSEYSRLRGAAMKRLQRLEAAGLAVPGITLPKVSDLKTARERRAATERIQAILQNPRFTVKGAREAGARILPGRAGLPEALTKKQLQGRAKRERARQRREAELQKLETNKQRGFIKGAQRLKIHIPTRLIGVFVEYMEYRFSQIKESKFYAFATYSENFEAAAKKDPEGVRNIIADFDAYQAERAAWIEELKQAGGYTEEKVQQLWTELIGSKYGKSME